MPLPPDYFSMGTSLLIDELIQTATERGCLIADGALPEELAVAQGKIDLITQVLSRRMAW